MMCFRIGCPCGIDGPGSVEFTLNIGTQGNIGSSVAILTLKFCSIPCLEKFLSEHPRPKEYFGRNHFSKGGWRKSSRVIDLIKQEAA